MKSTDCQEPFGEVPELGRIMPDPQTQDCFCQPMDEYCGMWHGQTRLENSPYVWKYSGGLGTYPYQTRPMAVYAPEVHRTFFCYGGTTPDNHLLPERRWDFQGGNLLQMVSYFDHGSATFPQPVCVFDKWCADPHDNPALQIDADGFLWLFSPSHGGWTTRSFIHRSRRPYDINDWETISDGPLFAYPQPHYSERYGWCMVHVIYEGSQRGLYVKHSRDGATWTPSVALANIACGHYAVSWANAATGQIGIAFDFHPEDGGLEARTNLYYLQSPDWGHTWHTICGKKISLPVTDPHSEALVLDLQSEGKLNYLRDLKFDRHGNPVIVFVSSRSWEPGPQSGPHQWQICRWDGSQWVTFVGMRCDNNYDHGELSIAEDDTWLILAPTEPGPQPGNPGGEVALWVSNDFGVTWIRQCRVTSDSSQNHTFCRRPLNAHPEFAAFWANGNPREPSASDLYFCNADGACRKIQADNPAPRFQNEVVKIPTTSSPPDAVLATELS